MRLAGWVWEVLMGLPMDRTAHEASQGSRRRVGWQVKNGRGYMVFCRGSLVFSLLLGCRPSVEVVWWWSIREEAGEGKEGDGVGDLHSSQGDDEDGRFGRVALLHSIPSCSPPDFWSRVSPCLTSSVLFGSFCSGNLLTERSLVCLNFRTWRAPFDRAGEERL